MDSKLVDVWAAAAGNPFLPTVGKNTQFLVAFVLLLLGLSFFGFFALSKPMGSRVPMAPSPLLHMLTTSPDRSLVNVPVIGIPASLALAYVCLISIRPL